MLDKIGAEKKTVSVDVDRTLSSRLAGLASDADHLASELDKVSPAAGGAGGGLQGFLTEIPGIPPVSGAAAGAIVGVLIPSIVALGGALGAILASLAAAAAGLAALGVAAAAAFGPVILLAGLAVKRIMDASQAQKTYQAAQQAVKTASEALTNAEASQQTAVDGLKRARQAAAQQIRTDHIQAVDGLRTAEQGVTAADYQAKQAEEALTLARQAARRAIIDEKNAAKDAALSHSGAILQLREARSQLRQLQDSGTASPLQLAEARHAVAEAEQQVRETRIASTRAQHDANRAEHDGVNGAPAVVQARHAVQEADQGVANAARKLVQAEAAMRKANAETVNSTPAVISARQAVASADRQVADAANRLHVAQDKANKALRAVKDTGAAQGLIRIVKSLGRAIQPAVDPIIRGIARGFRVLRPLITSLEPALHRLGRVMGQAFVGLARELTRPAWQRFFRLLLRSSAELVRTGSRGFILLLRILRNIAESAMPFLIRGLRDFNHFLAETARGSRGIDLSGPIHQLGLWLRLGYQLGRIFLGFVRAATGAGGGLVAWLTKGAKALGDWLNSTEGKNRLAQFFKDTLPLARDLITLFLQLTVAFIQLGQFLAPVLDPFVRALILIARGLNFVLNLLNKLPAPLRSFALLGPFIAPISLAFNHLGEVVHFVFGIIRRAANGIASLFRGSRWDGIKAVLTAPFRLARGILRDVFGFIRDKVGGLVDWVSGIFKGSKWEGVKGVLTAPFRLAKRVFTDVFGFIRDKVRAIVHFVVDRFHNLADIPQIVSRVFGRVVRFLRGLPGDFLRLGKRIITGLIHGIEDKASDVVDAVKGIVSDAKDEVTSGFGLFSPSRVFHDYGQRLMQGFRNGIVEGMRLVTQASRDAVRTTRQIFSQGVQNILDAFGRLPDGLGRQASQIARIFRQLSTVVLRASRFIMHAVRRLTSGLGAKSRLPQLDLQLPDLNPSGFAKGGVVDRPTYIVGEEAPRYREYVIAENPAYRPRNLSLWAQAGRALGIQGFAQGGIVGVPGFPGEQANSRIISALESFAKQWKLFLTDAYGSGHASVEHTQYGTAADFVPGPGGSWALVGRAAEAAVRAGYTPVGYDGRDGTEAWSGHGPPSVAGANAHVHVTFLTAAEYLAGKVLKGVAGAAAALIPKILVKGDGPLAEIARSAIDTMRSAGNRYIEAHQPTTTADVSTAGGKGSVARQAAQAVRRAGGEGVPALALFEALWTESTMGAASANVLQLTGPKAGGVGPDSSPFAQAIVFLTRGYTDGIGAIRRHQMNRGEPAYAIAQDEQGSGAGQATHGASNYGPQRGRAIASMIAEGLRVSGLSGYALGGTLGRAALGLIGAEAGARELALLPGGTEIIPADITQRLTAALMDTGGGVGRPVSFAGVGGGGRDRPVEQHFHIAPVPGTGQPDPRVTAAKLGILIRQRRDF